MSSEDQKVKHSKRRHKSIAKNIYEEKNNIKHSHHTDNKRKILKEPTIQEKKWMQVKTND